MSFIKLINVGKAYKRYRRKYGRFFEWFCLGKYHNLVWVLQNVSFEVAPGEAVGIVGINGAGKSTLLKIIAGVVKPTTGSVEVGGKVSALLELGLGFHPDFTGRENVFMAAQLQGMTKREIKELMPEIEAFAEIGDYIDQPVRVYSSGMQVRLAFSIATAVRPDVLIIDEALSVGDAAFQRKCFQRIEKFQSEGTTLLFVSHAIDIVKKMCSRAVFLHAGQIRALGEAKKVCDEYERFLFGGHQKERASYAERGKDIARFDPSLIPSCEMVYGTGEAEIEACWIEDVHGRRINVVEYGQPFTWRYRVKFNTHVQDPIFAMLIKTREGIELYGVDTKYLRVKHGPFYKGEVVDVKFRLTNCLAPGIYYFNCGVRVDDQEVRFLSRRIDSAILRVSNGENSTAAVGVMDMNSIVEISKCYDEVGR